MQYNNKNGYYVECLPYPAKRVCLALDLKNEPELAEQLFRKTLELSPDPHTRSWSEIYLGRLAEGYGERAQAAQHYQAALAVEGAPPGARQAAEQGLQKAPKP